MRRLTFLFVTICSVFTVTLFSKPAHAQLGIAAGLNYDSVSDLDAGDVSASFDAASGYHAGLFYDLSLGTVGVRLGAFYRDLGDIDSDNDGGVDIPDVDVADALDRFDLAMVDFPVDIRLNLTASPLVQPYFLFGPVFSVPSSGNDFIDKNLESLLVTGNVGMGLSINIAGISLFPEFRYSIGITRLIKDSVEIGGVAVETDVQRVNSVLLRIGIVL